jgi:acetyl-CoA acetyltransferase
MRDVYIIGVNTTKFGRHLDKTIPELTAMTVIPCLKDADIDKKDLQAIWFSNSGWGEYRRQVCIRGQVALRPLGIDAIPITNVENACASGSTALHHAWLGVASGLHDLTMAVGAEKIYDSNQALVFSSFLTGLDVGNLGENIDNLLDFALSPAEKKAMEEHLLKYKQNKKSKKKKSFKDKYKVLRDNFVVGIRLGETMGYDLVKRLRKEGVGGDKSAFMDVYGHECRKHMGKYGTTIEQLALIASKNHFHSTLNPNAQYQFPLTQEEVIADRIVTWPLTRSMCAPVGDGAASAVLCDEKTVDRLGLRSKAVKIRASVLGSGRARTLSEPDLGERLSKRAYEISGTGPADMNLAEVHDATVY